MRAHVGARRGHQPRIQAIIDAIRNRLHGLMARPDRTDDLLFSLESMRDVARYHSSRGVDGRSVRRKQLTRFEFLQPLERRQIVDEPPAASSVDDNAPARDDEIARKDRTARLVP